MTGIFLIMTATLLWAVDTLFRYPLLGMGVSTLQIVFFEHLLLVALIVPWLWRRGQLGHLADRRLWPGFLMIGALGSALGTLAFTKAFSLINPSLVILLQKLQPLVAITLAYFWLKEPVTGRFLRGAALCFAGSLLLMHQELLSLFAANSAGELLSLNNQALLGYGLALLAVISWGCSTVFGKHLIRQQVPGDAIMGGRFVMGFIALLPLYLMMPSSDVAPLNREFLQPLIAMVLLSGVLGMSIYYQGLKRVPARLGALAEMFFPVAAITVNWVVLDISLEAIQLAGAALLITGSLLVQRQTQASPARAVESAA